MRRLIALVVMVCVMSFAGFSHAADAKTGKSAPHKGVFEKVDGKNVYYKGGSKGKGQEWYLPADDKVAVTIDGKEGALADLKAGQTVSLTVSKEVVITKIAAESPKEKK
jgi:hypothetical protein